MKRVVLALILLCVGARVAHAAVAATPANVRNVWLEPAFLCAGQTVTAHFEAMRGVGQDLSVLGALSTDNAFSAGDSYFIHDHGVSFFYETFAWPISDALTTPGLVTTVWDRVTFNAPVNTANENFLPYSAVFTVPAWMLSGTTYYVLIKVVNSTSNVSGFATASTGLVAFPVEASCCKVLVHNVAGYGAQFSLSSTADVIFDLCGTPTYTPTITRTSTPTRSVTATPTSTPTSTPTRTPSITLTATPTATPTATRTNTPSPTQTITFTMTRTITPTATPTNSPSRTVTSTITPTITQTVTPSSTPTRSVTQTQTPTSTRTATPTFSPTQSVTATATPTRTQSVTPSATPTQSFTYTQTPSSTPTVTASFSPTQTVTRTSTPTSTQSATPSATPTQSFTFTRTTSSTITPTTTPTQTQTVTYTYTPTSTYTATPSATATATPSATQSITWTFSPTRTATPTITPSPTQSITWTASPTVTPTGTPSATPTATPTASPTPTATPSATQSITWTFSPTVSPSGTATPTPTATPTQTPTGTPTASPSVTPTATPTATETPNSTDTNTPSVTPTVTPSATDSATPTGTPSWTATPTATPSATVTRSATSTFTPPATPTDTPQTTPTDSPSITPTFTPLPALSATIKIFNSAGELVYSMPGYAALRDLPTGLDASSNVALPDDGGLAVVKLQGTNYIFTWDGSSNSGAKVSSGAYQMQVSVGDSFGGQTTLMASLVVMRTPNVITVSVFNSAGELVRRFDRPAGSGGGTLSLDRAGFSPDPADSNNKVTLTYGQGATDFVTWDGTDARGRIVASGTYQIVVERQLAGAKPSTQTTSISIIKAFSSPLAEAIAAPNPVLKSDFVDLLAPNLGLGGWMWAKVYNMAGELVVQAQGTSPRLRVTWAGKKLAGGTYLIRLEAQDAVGGFETKLLKVALVP